MDHPSPNSQLFKIVQEYQITRWMLSHSLSSIQSLLLISQSLKPKNLRNRLRRSKLQMSSLKSMKERLIRRSRYLKKKRKRVLLRRIYTCLYRIPLTISKTKLLQMLQMKVAQSQLLSSNLRRIHLSPSYTMMNQFTSHLNKQRNPKRSKLNSNSSPISLSNN